MEKPILCLDFDGVIHSYTSGWKGFTTIPDPVTKGFFDWLEEASKLFKVVIFSSRCTDPRGIKAMREWLRGEATAHYVTLENVPDHVRLLTFADHKPAALVTIDDRAVTFDGDWSHYDPKKLRDFQPWYKLRP
jgi:hypothetical protein